MLSNSKSSCACDGTSYPLPLLHVEIFVCRGLVWILVILSQSLKVLKYTCPFVSRKCYFFVVIYHLWLLQSFFSCSVKIPQPCMEGQCIDVPFRVENSEVFYSLQVGQLWSFLLTAIYYQKKLLWWELRDALIHEYIHKSFGFIFAK